MHFNNFQEYYAFKRGKIETLKARVVKEHEDETETKRGNQVSSDSKPEGEGSKRKKSDKDVEIHSGGDD